MKRTLTIHTAVLIALPFMLLPAAYWLAGNALVPASPGTWLQSVIWSLRVIYVGGAFVGWRAGRPHWFYPWLGFASYAAVAALLQLAFRIDPWETVGFSPFLGFVPILLAFSPYFVTALLVGWRKSRRLLGAYTVFPHAALIIPLFNLVEGGRLWQRFALCYPFSSGCRRFLNAVLASSYSVPGWNQKLAASATSLPGCSCHECTVCARLRLRVWSWERLGHLDNVGPNSRHELSGSQWTAPATAVAPVVATSPEGRGNCGPNITTIRSRSAPHYRSSCQGQR